MNIDINNIIISKPIKHENTYICPIFYKSQPQELKLNIDKALIVSIKPLQTRNENIITLKSNLDLKFFIDLNFHILDIVKQKTKSWFKNNLSIDLVEDYFINLVGYDKKYGDVIKIKIIGDDEQLKAYLLQNVNLNFTAQNIRFYKQKFIVEFTINNVSLSKSIAAFKEVPEENLDEINEEDEPFPSCDIILNMKDEYLEKIKQMRAKLAKLTRFEKELLNTSDLKSILQICDKVKEEIE
jgi:hypothetical protein